MVVTCVFWVDEPLDWDRATAAFAELVPAFPRFAQRVIEPAVTFGLVGPRWADVPGFDVGDHLRRVLLPATGGDDELHAHVSARADRPPDSARPLWRADLIDGYRTGCAVLLRTHHAIADDTALVQVLLTLADGRSTVPGTQVSDSSPAPAARRCWPAGPATRSRHRPAQPGARRRRAGRDAAPARVRLGGRPSVLRTPLSGRKRMTWSPTVPLEQVERAGRAHDATAPDHRNR